jgi:hypothetical protein
MAKKYCFMDADRPCDLTCKAAFEVDDPVDNVDCYFIWLSHHFGEGLFELRRVVEGMHGVSPGASATPGSGPGPGSSGPPGPPGSPGPKGPKGFSNN